MAFVWVLACGRSTMVEAPPTGHADTWAALVAAVDRGDLATAKVQARDLDLGADDDGSPPTAALGAALGFLQVCDDAEDAHDAVEKAEAACAACHRARGVTAAP